MPPADIQRLRDQTRLRKALAEERTGWEQRLHALLTQEGWPCPRGRLLTAEGRRWVDALELDPGARAQIEVMLTVMAALQEQLERLEAELRRFARGDRRCRALETIFGVGPILACHLLAEIGDASRFRRPRQLVRASGLDPTSPNRLTASGAGGSRSRARRICAGPWSRRPTTATGAAALSTPSTAAPRSVAGAAAPG